MQRRKQRCTGDRERRLSEREKKTKMVVVANSRIELIKLFAKKIYYEAVKKKKGKKKKA